MENTQNIFSLSHQLTTLKLKPSWPVPSCRSQKQLEHLKALHQRNFEQGVMRYRRILEGKGWLNTFEIECRLGCMPTAANAFLRKLVKLKYIERRPRGNTKTYIKNRGWEFQWVVGR